MDRSVYDMGGAMEDTGQLEFPGFSGQKLTPD
jgi:hypothetical protein